MARSVIGIKAIAKYLEKIWQESCRRSYSFNRSKIGQGRTKIKIAVSRAELQAEFDWLKQKLKKRNHEKFQALRQVKNIRRN
ncbi:MAG: hypothetical protein ABIE84_05500, partial [bacterium]